MTSWRTWLLLLLAALLPARGAVAAAMLCPVAGYGAQMEVAMLDHPGGHAAVDDAMSHHPPGGHDHAAGHAHAPGASGDVAVAHDHAASEGCNACSAYCSLTPLLSRLPVLVEPRDPMAVRFPRLSAPPPSFVSDGQERPPRTC